MKNYCSLLCINSTVRSKTLNDVALSSPHAAYAALTHGISSFWLFICRTTPNIAHLLQPLEDYLRNNLIPTLTGTDPLNDLVRKLYALPVRLGGLNIISPSSLSQEYHYSVSLSDPLISVLSGRSVFSSDIVDHMYSLKHSVHQKKRKELEAEMCNLLPSLHDDMLFVLLKRKELLPGSIHCH